jgi:Trypsin-like peptidase domain/Effector-associated domain 1
MANGSAFTQHWMTAFRNALDEAFDEGSVTLLVADYFGKNFAKISSPGLGKRFDNRLQELIDAARMEDWLLDLVAAARERRPKNAVIGDIAERLGLTIAGPRLINQTRKPLEEVIRENATFIKPAAFRERMADLEGQVCWLNVPGGGGTGFLVGPDLVLTNQHVIARVTNNLTRASDVVCRFDYREALDGSVPTQKKPTEVPLAPNWLIDSQPPSTADWDPTMSDATEQESDYAIVRLAERIGDQPVGGATADVNAQPRKWIDTTVAAPALTAGKQIFLLQHPRGEPLQLTIGTITAFNARGTRVRYDANSKDGSSGSPCFDADLNLVALHHAHDTAKPPAWNQGIPFSLIKNSWKLS